MRAVKLLGKVFAVILSCVFACFLLFVMYVLIAKTMLTEESIYNYVIDTNVFTSPSNNVERNSLKQGIVSDLKKFDIPASVTVKTLESNDISRVISRYAYDYTRYVLYNKGAPSLDNDEIVRIFNNEYKSATGDDLSNIQVKKLKEYVSSTEMKLDDSVPSVGDLQGYGVDIYNLRLVNDFVSSDYMLIVFGVFILSFYTLIAICLWSKLRAFKWIGIVSMIDGFVLIISSFLEVRLLSMFINKNGVFENLAITVASKNFGSLLLAGIVLIVVGIVFLIICALLMKKEHKVDSDKLLDSVIKSEISSMDKGDSLDSDEDISKDDDFVKENEINNIDEKIDDNLSDKNVLEENNDDKVSDSNDAIEDDNRNVDSETEYVSDIIKVDINEVDDDLPVSEVNILEDKEIPVIKIEGNDNEDGSSSLVEAVSIADNVVNDDSLKDSSGDEVTDDSDVSNDDESVSDVEDDKTNDSDDTIEIVPDEDFEVVTPKEEDVVGDEVITIDTDLDEDVNDNTDDVESDNNTEYEEIDDSNYEIEKHDIDVLIPENVSLSVVTPKKGKDIEPDLVEVLGDEEEEDVELL